MRIPQLYKGRVPRLFGRFLQRGRKALASPPSEGRTCGLRANARIGIDVQQFAALDRVQAVLSEKEGEMKAESEKKRRSYRSLGALAGAMVAVILY